MPHSTLFVSLAAGRARSGILKPGTMIVQQPEIPLPLLLRFPFPAWATRKSEVDTRRLSEAEVFKGFSGEG